MLDCYRPVRAVHDMVMWAHNGRETPAERRYNPCLPQGRSVPAGLYRRTFRPFHRRCRRPDAGRSEGRQFRRVRSRQGLCRLHRCRGRPRPGRQASIWAPAMIVPTSRRTPRRDRSRRRSADGGTCWLPPWRRQGFVNYSKEWWHFSLPGAGGPAYDFPITGATQLSPSA